MDEKIKKAMEYAKASNAMEGLYLTPEQEKLVLEKDEGKITEEEFRKRALDLAKN